MILHTVSASPDSSTFRDFLSVLSSEDAVLLVGDGVYASLPGNPQLAVMLARGADVHVLADDAQAAGITEPAEGIKRTDIEGFVLLTERHPRQMAWFP